MKIKDWHVMVGSNNRHDYFYGDLSEFEPEEYNDMKEIPYELWEAKDFSEIFGNILEDRNHHWMTDITDILLTALESALLPANTVDFIMKKFVETVEDRKF